MALILLPLNSHRQFKVRWQCLLVTSPGEGMKAGLSLFWGDLGWVVHGHEWTLGLWGRFLAPSLTWLPEFTWFLMPRISRNVPGASVRNSTRDKVTARLIRPQVFPLEFPEHPPPQNKNLPAFVLCFSTFLIFSGKKSTQGFSLLHLKGMFQLNPSDSSLACLTGSPGLLTACELLAPPNCERHKA